MKNIRRLKGFCLATVMIVTMVMSNTSVAWAVGDIPAIESETQTNDIQEDKASDDGKATEPVNEVDDSGKEAEKVPEITETDPVSEEPEEEQPKDTETTAESSEENTAAEAVSENNTLEGNLDKAADTVTIDFNTNAKEKFVVITDQGYSIGLHTVKVGDKNWVPFQGRYIITGYRQHTVHIDNLDIVYVKGGSAENPIDITLKDLTIDLTNEGLYDYAEGIGAIGIGTPSAKNYDDYYYGSHVNAHITLEGTNLLKGAPASTALGLGRYASLTLDGPGELTAIGGDGHGSSGGWASPGIGSDIQSDANHYTGHITINSGTIYAYGGNQDDANGKPVTTKAKSHMGVAIGGGAGTVTINGGHVEATGGSRGAGIGTTQFQLNSSDNYSKVEIRNAEVIAKGGYGAPGIGAAGNDNDKNGFYNHTDILIEDANVTATGGIGGAGIGTGNNKQAVADSIVIKNSVVSAGAPMGACIGTGIYSSSQMIQIENSTLDLTGGEYSAAIGGSFQSQAGNINIIGSNITARGGLYGAGIGSGGEGETASINISTSSITAIGGLYGAGIGNGIEAVKSPVLSVDDSSDVSAYAMGYYEADESNGIAEGSVSAIEVDEANSNVSQFILQGRFKTPIADAGDKDFTMIHKDGTTAMKMPYTYNAFGRVMPEQNNVNVYVDDVIQAGSLIENSEDNLFKNFDLDNQFKKYWMIQPFKVVNVTFEANGGTPVPEAQEIESGSTAAEPNAPGKAGYTFAGWYEEPECINLWDFSTVINTDKILYAKWIEAADYSVIYNTAGGSMPDGVPSAVTGMKYTDIIPTPVPVRNGYEFQGWTYMGNTVESSMNYNSLVNDDTIKQIELTAQWKAMGETRYVTEHYKQNKDGSWPKKASESETGTGKANTVVNGQVRQYEGYVFDAAVEGSRISGTIKEDGSLVLKLYYKVRHTISFDSDGGNYTPGDESVIHGSQMNKPEDPVKEGYTFDGWYYKDKDGKEHKWNFDEAVTGDMKLTAHWKKAGKQPMPTPPTPPTPVKPSGPSSGEENKPSLKPVVPIQTPAGSAPVTAQKKETVRRAINTGDRSNIAVFIILLGISSAVGVTILVKKRRTYDI